MLATTAFNFIVVANMLSVTIDGTHENVDRVARVALRAAEIAVCILSTLVLD